MTEIASNGNGRFYHVWSSDEISQTMTAELREATDLAARDVKIRIQIRRSSALIPLSPSYHCEVIDREAVVYIGDKPIDLEVEVPLLLTFFPDKEGNRLNVNIEISYKTTLN